MKTKTNSKTATPQAGAATSKTATVVKKKRTVAAKKITEIEPAKEKELDTANAAAAAKKITEKKDLMYQYSKEDDTLEKRKKFRAKVRAEIRRIEKLLGRLKSSELDEDVTLYNAKYKELEKTRARYYTKDYLATLQS